MLIRFSIIYSYVSTKLASFPYYHIKIHFFYLFLQKTNYISAKQASLIACD